MIFKQIQEIVSGAKTQTRRLVKDGDFAANSYGISVGDINEWNKRFKDLWDLNNPYRTSNYGTCVMSSGSRIRWQIGRSYSVVPKRGAPAVWISPDGTIRTDAIHYKPRGINSDTSEWEQYRVDQRDVFKERGHRELRIRITGIRQQRLQDITEEDAIAEGFRRVYGTDSGSDATKVTTATCVYMTSVLPNRAFDTARGGYQVLWDSINGKTKGARWQDNPPVWCLSFEVAP